MDITFALTLSNKRGSDMSYDIYLNMFDGKDYLSVMDVGNHTSNTAQMWTEAMGCPLSHLDGIMAVDAIYHLEKGIRAMEDEPEYFKKMNPPNGWGNYDTALAYLKSILAACKDYPLTKIEISR